jgi:hypothetical protein
VSELQTRGQKPVNPNAERIAIIGGGIAGLFCAYVLADDGHQVELFESSDVLGGRIRSFRFNPKLLNEVERKVDEDRTPIKDSAILEDALHPDLLTPPSTPPNADGTKWTPTPEDPLRLDEDAKSKNGSEKAGAASNKGSGVKKTPPGVFFSAPEYDKRLWDGLEFNAEFGPMRIELEVQRMLAFLLKRLNIPGLNDRPPTVVVKASDLVRMQRFPAFSSPASAGDPVYDLTPEEEGKNPLELLKLGVCRAVVDLHFNAKKSPLNDEKHLERQKYSRFKTSHDDLIERLGKAAATQRPSGPVFESWVRNHLHEDDFWVIQRYGQIPVLYGAEDYIDLHTMGFWNLLAAYLSHNALSKIRELGTFYHLIPENPNAGEWLTWWLRQISISSQLEGVFGGMQSVIEKLVDATGIKIGVGSDKTDKVSYKNRGSLKIYRKATVTDLTVDKEHTSKIKVTLFKPKKQPAESFDRVIVALPTVPAEKLTQNSNLWDTTESEQNDKNKFLDHLDSALPFQLLKAFFVVRERWWEEDVRANPGATRYPTREAYFWKSRIKESRRGLIMLYTDRPAAAFWANYVPGSTQDDIDELCRSDPQDADAGAVQTLRARIKSRFVEYVNENEGVKIAPEDIIWCGIMDWGREPYGAASHTWRPNREYWNTLAELAHWKVKSAKGPGVHLHVCGEAYSDYHAFIEGALRSAVHVLTQIGNESKEKRLAAILRDLLGEEKVKAIFKRIEEGTEQGASKAIGDKSLALDAKYVEDFLGWSTNLDSSREDAKPT